MIDDNRDDPSSGNEKHVLVDGDSSEDEQNEIEDGSDTARIAQSVTDFSRRCLQTGAYSKALIALQNAVEIAEMPSLAYRQAVFQTAQVLKASRAFQSSIECMLIIYHNMPTPYNRRDGVIIVARLYEELGDARAAAFWVKKAAISDSLASIYQVLGDLAFEHQDYVFAADFYAQSIDRNHSDPVNSIRTVYRLLFSLGQFTSPCIALHRHQRQLLAWRLVREFQFNRYLYAETDFWKLRNLCEGSFPSIYRAIFLWEEEYGKRIARWWKRLRSPQPKFSEYAEEDERLDKERASPISMKKSKTRQRPNLKKNVRNPYEDPAPLPRKPPVPRQSSPKRLAQSKQNQESSPPKHTESTVGENDVPKGKNDQKAQNSKPTAAEYEPSPTKRKLSAVRRLRRRQLDDDVRSPRPALPFTGSEPTLITTSDVPDNLLEIYPLQLPSIDEFLLAHGRHPGMAELDIRQVEEFARIAHYRARVIATKHLSVASLTSERVKPHWLQDLDKAVVMLTSFQRSRQRLDEDSIVHLAEIHARLVFQLENVYHQYFKEYGTTAFGIELQSLISQLSAWGFDTIGNVMDALKCVVQLAVEDEKQRNLEFYHVHRLPGDIGEKLTRGTAEK